MPVVVQKYGGTSVADPSRIAAVADRVVATRSSGKNVVVVVSAMGQTTDSLLDLASQVSSTPHPREMDMLLTAGERISMALLAMALHDRDVPAVSFTGSQAGILTDSAHGSARITRITGERVRSALAEEKVVIVAGFQGVDPHSREVTTLGRGGSDTTAVALAAALEAESCEILTDVDGVFTADPRVVPEAVKVDSLGYGQMLALAEAGAGVLMPHSVEFAMDSGVPVHVRSSFTEQTGTWVDGETDPLPFAGLAHRAEGGQGLVTLVGTEARSSANDLAVALGEAGIVAAPVSASDQSVSMTCAVEQTEAMIRFLHGRLFEEESR
ncbi:MAG: aspartate kinase [Acidimicrobiia bacterium]|nr:aspartate kinase [Acidimicrobiia bacterium]